MNKIIIYFLVLSTLTVSIVPAHAGRSVVLDDGSEISVPNDKVKNVKLSDKDLTIIGFTLEQDKIMNVINHLGYEKYKTYPNYPMVGHSPIFVCYISSAENDDTTLVFEADPQSKILSSINLISDKHDYSAYDCGKSKAFNRATGIDNGLKLGMTRQQVKKILGPPSLSDKKSMYYMYEYEDRTQNEDYILYINSFIQIDFEHDKVIGISVSKSEEI